MNAICNHCGRPDCMVLIAPTGAAFLCGLHDAAARAQSLVVPDGGCSGWVITADLKVTA